MALRHLVNYSSVNVRIGSVGVFIGGGGGRDVVNVCSIVGIGCVSVYRGVLRHVSINAVL